jgi:gamma-tubulin complex component 3
MAVEGAPAASMERSKDSSTAALVRRLVRTTLTRRGARDASEADVDRVYRYALRVVGSSLHASVEPDENAAADAIRRRLSREGKPAGAGVAFAELHRRLAQQPGLNARWALLHALLRVAENAGAGNESAIVSPGADAAAAALLANPLSAAAERGGLPALAEARDATTSPADAADALDAARALAAGDGGTLGLEHAGARRLAHEELAAEAIKNMDIGEPELVRDVLFACQGIDGKCLRFDARRDAYVVDDAARVSPGARRLAEKLAECGWLFRKVRAHAEGRAGEAEEGTTTDPTDATDPTTDPTDTEADASDASDRGGAEGSGSTRQAFRAAVSLELAEYYRLIAVLEAQAQVPMASALETSPRGTSRSDGASSSYVSLRRLSVWLAEPARRLRLLAVLCDATRRKRGGALLRALHEHAKHGDPATRTTCDRLLAAASAPTLATLKMWVVRGELDDPRGEFFVASDPTVGEDDLWRRGYRIEYAMMPPFVDVDLARDALKAGKSINFLRRRCGDDAAWAAEQAPVLVAAENAGGLRYGNARALRALVTEAKRRIDRCLRRSLFDTYGLYDHVFAAKRYLLMGQGDFHAVLMDAVGADLDEPAGGLSAYALTGALETATRASNAQFDPPEILDKLRVATARAVGSEETGWDVFSLRYATSAPLDVVFTPEAESKYLRVFTFLWRLKRVEVSLNATWQTMKPNVAASLERDGVAGPAGAALAAELRRCHTLRGEMHHFVSNLQYYVMFEVLEGSWDAFTRELNDADDLDALVQAHDTFLDAVTRKSLLSPASQLLAHTLGAIFDAILRFRAFADRLYEVAKDAAMRRQLAQLRVEQREKSGERGGWGTTPGEDPSGGDGLLSGDFVREMRSQLDALSDEYAKMLDGFLNLLPLQTHVDLRFLLFRLDFSEFYSEKERGRSVAGA